VVVCNNPICPSHNSTSTKKYQKYGYYKTKHNGQPVPRYKCNFCSKTLSGRSMLGNEKLKKPELTEEIFKLYCERMSIRGISRVLKIDKETVMSRIAYLGMLCLRYHNAYLKAGLFKSDIINYDEMETKEITKLKPISVGIACCGYTGFIIDAQACEMPAKRGSSRAIAKYGFRPDFRGVACDDVLGAAKLCCPNDVTIIADDKRAYRAWFKRSFPQAKIFQAKRLQMNVLFPAALHDKFKMDGVCANIREDVSRFTRRSRIITKRMSMLQAHLYMYMAYHNGYNIRHIINEYPPELSRKVA
jgi:transposase-like protein